MSSLQKSSLPVVTRKVTFMDFVVFQVKLALEGTKDVVLASLSVIAIVIDMIAGGGDRPRRFYAVMRLGQRFDRWLRLYSAKGFRTSEGGGREQEYVSGADEKGAAGGRILGSDADTLIDKLEDFVEQQGQSTERVPRRQDRGEQSRRERDLEEYDRDLDEFDRNLRSRGNLGLRGRGKD